MSEVDVQPTLTLVVGMFASGVEMITRQLVELGLQPLELAPEFPDVSEDLPLARFNEQLLADLGCSWIEPKLLPRPELLARLVHRRPAASELLAERMGASSVASQEAAGWVWGDPRLSILAPFWADLIGRSPSVVLVHRHPASVAVALSDRVAVPYTRVLEVWDEYTRIGLNLAEWHAGMVVGIEAFEADVAGGVSTLRSFLNRNGRKTTDEQATDAVGAFMPLIGPKSVEPIPHKLDVLHRTLCEVGLKDELDPKLMAQQLGQYYDSAYYADYGNPGDAPYRPGEQQWLTFFSQVAAVIKREINPGSVLDVGCAIGFLVDALRSLGVEAWGIDVSEWAISQVPEHISPYCSVQSLVDEIHGHFDLITCIEVIEHMPEGVAGAVIANLTRHSDAILFSSTPNGFEEPTHINVQTPDYWARLFAANGFFRDFQHDAGYLSRHAVLYRASEFASEELVEGYELGLWRIREDLQGHLDVIVPERDALIVKIGEYAERAGLAEHQVEALLDQLGQLQERRLAESVAAQAELLRRDQDASRIHWELEQTRTEAMGARAAVSAIENTKVFRYSAGLRRVYGEVRRRTQAGAALGGTAGVDGVTRLSYAQWVERYDTLDDAARKRIRARMNSIADPPMISVILPVFDTPERFLRDALDSVVQQIYPHWELCVADDCSTDPGVVSIVEEYAARDDRIRIVRRAANGHISAASNSALEVATGRWVALLDHDDRLREHALALMAIEADLHPDAGLVYSDENIVDENGHPLQDFFKPEFDPLLLMGMNHICHLAMIRRDLVTSVGGFREGFEGSQDWDLLLRITERLRVSEVRHVPHVLYDWRSHPGSTAQALSAKPYAADAGRRAVVEHLGRLGREGTVVPIPALGWNRVKWAVPAPAPLVSIIIPTRDGKWLARCLESIWSFTTYPHVEIIVVDNGSTEASTLEFLRRNEGRITIFRDDRPFSYSGLNNAAAARARGSILCLLNDDTEVISPDWLEELVGQLLQPRVGAVGAKLFYDDGSVQHAGVVLGIGGIGGHVHRGIDRLDKGYFGRAACAQHFSAVTGACLLVRRDAWDEVDGLNDTRLSVGYNDVDLCLRLGEAGWGVVWTPFAELTHHESVSRGADVEGANALRLAGEARYMRERWESKLRNDPAYNPNLTLAHENFSLAYPPRVEYVWAE